MKLRVGIYGEQSDVIVGLSSQVVTDAGCELASNPVESDIAIAPLLRRKITSAELAMPRIGTLIFHPSLLPIHRGRDAIRWSFHNKEMYTGATWFWADAGLDTGDICECEALLWLQGETPREFYQRAVIPSALRMLNFILVDLKEGIVRRRPQVEEHSTYDPPFSERKRIVSQ